MTLSRSLGDLKAKEYGVVSSPQLIEYILHKNSLFMVICSDGVWKILENEQVISLGKEFFKKKDIGGYCIDLVKCAVYSWEKYDIYRDNISVLCVYFN